MLRMATSCILIPMLTITSPPLFAAELPVAVQAARIKQGRKIDVKLSSGEVLKGRMGLIESDQFTLEPRNTPGNSRVIRFSEATTVKASGLTTGQKWMIFGIAWVVVGIVGKAAT